MEFSICFPCLFKISTFLDIILKINNACICLFLHTMLCVTTLPSLSTLALTLFLCGFSSYVSNVSQLEMSKQDDRGSEESANQTSVSGEKV